MIEMKDFLGKKVQVGDKVIIIEPYYHNLIRGLIVKFTPKGVKVKYRPFCRSYDKETFVGNGGFVKVEVKDD